MWTRKKRSRLSLIDGWIVFLDFGLGCSRHIVRSSGMSGKCGRGVWLYPIKEGEEGGGEVEHFSVFRRGHCACVFREHAVHCSDY